MKQNNEINRVNYANTKHHRQLIRENIDSQLINQIETSTQPSLNYQSAFKNVYIEELEKTMLYQQQKKHTPNTLRSSPTMANIISPGYGSPINSKMGLGKIYRPLFSDYEQERRKKFDDLINKGCQEGGLIFKAQDQYQANKHFQSQMTKNFLKQQLYLKDQKRSKQNFEKFMVEEQTKKNRLRQIEMQHQRTSRIKEEKINESKCLQEMMQKERERRERKSLFKLGGYGRHNPITNPIEYHIDNPYILQKMQRRLQS